MSIETSDPSSPTGRPFRRRVAADIFATSFPGDPDRLWVDVGFAVEGWHARPPARPGRPDFPGTPIQLPATASDARRDHDWWEIVATRLQDDIRGRERFVYELRPWPEGQIIRQGFELTSESARRLTQEHRLAARRDAESDRAALFMPFYGFLPVDDQEEIESRHGLPPGRATVITALLLLPLSIYGVMLALAGSLGLGGDDVQFAQDFKYLLGYLALESILRLSMGITGQAMGSALVVIPLAALRALRPAPGSEDTLPAVPMQLPRDTTEWQKATDVVKRLPPSDDGLARLEVVSALPKEHWRAQVDLMYLDDKAYVLEERQETPAGHRFLLHEPPPGVRRTRAVHHYEPTEVREVYKEKQRLKAEAWLETLSPLVGFTEPPLQLELAEFTRYKPYRAAAQSVVFALLFGGVSLMTGWEMLQNAKTLESAPADFVFFLALGALMIWENGVRGVRLVRGEITPGFLGRLVSPFARRALRWRPDPSWPYPATSRTG